MTQIRYQLESADGRKGIGWLGRDNFAWVGAGPKRRTVRATFVVIDDAGAEGETHEIDGNEWRELESNGELDMVLTWVDRGATLEAAVDACVQSVDPEGFDSDYEESIEMREDVIRQLRHALMIARNALDAMADGRTFNDVVESTGVTAVVLDALATTAMFEVPS